MWVGEEGREEEGELTPPHVPGGHAGGGWVLLRER
jgi:hypothetical protein